MKSILALLFFLPLFAMAQNEWDPTLYNVGKKYSGSITKSNGDVVKGYIEALPRAVPNELGQSNQTHCKFYANEGDKKPVDTYSPKELKGYTIGDKVYVVIPYSGGLVSAPRFCYQTQAGKISVFNFYMCKEGFNMMPSQGAGESMADYDARRFDVNQVYFREGVKPMDMAALTLGFAKKMSELVADCPELAEKVKNKEEGYRLLSINKIIDTYNAGCK
jgi:hypothetical protein